MSESENAPGATINGSSPASRGPAGAYIEGELGAFYLLELLAQSEPRGLPSSKITRVRFQGVESGFTLDDLIVHGVAGGRETILEIQSKRTIKFSPQDAAFKAVCAQIAASHGAGSRQDRHLLAVATQRTSYAISGPYQDVLEWARAADSGAEFFRRLSIKGVAGRGIRAFIDTFRTNLIAAGVADDDEAIWSILKRFLILEFDFEAGAALARTHALSLAAQVLSTEDAPRAAGLWNSLIALSLETAKVGGSLDRTALSASLVGLGFHLAGDRTFAPAKAKLAELSRHCLFDIGNQIAGFSLPRHDALAALDTARDSHRVIEIRGGPGVGKSAVLRQLAERLSRESHIFVLDPVSTPEGGWNALANWLGVATTAREFLTDLAVSGGGVLFIDSLEMFVAPAQRRTVNDLLREVAAIEGFSVVATARPDFGIEGENWLAEDARAALGAAHQVIVGELSEAEVDALSEHAPELRVLLSSGHPAANLARNLYRLSRLSRVPASTSIQTEAALAGYWWRSADGAADADVRAAQRHIADLADAAFAGLPFIESRTDSAARLHLLRTQTLREIRRDQLGFYHDVLRDWAIGARLHEDPDAVRKLDLTTQASPRLSRGVEIAGRMALETTSDGEAWSTLLVSVSPSGSHSSWRRQVLMAVLRSEASPLLLDRCSARLLASGGAILRELCVAVAAVETVSAATLLKYAAATGGTVKVPIPKTIRMAVTASAPRLLRWCLDHADDIPLASIGAVVKLVEIQFLLAVDTPALAERAAKMLFKWLGQLDVRNAIVVIPQARGAADLDSAARGRLVSELRTLTLFLSSFAPEAAKAYLRELTAEKGYRKAKEIRPFSGPLAKVAPIELANLISTSLLVAGRDRSSYRSSAFSFADNDYLPPSPAQPPFFHLLEAAPEVALELVHKLMNEAVAFFTDGADPGTDGFTLVFDEGPRFFPWAQTYFWSRGQAHDYAAVSALMAIEAWGHARMDRGEPIAAVLRDVLGPVGSCAAFVLVAIDLLLSHLPASRDCLVPFLGCPALLATEHGRQIHDVQAKSLSETGNEPAGPVQYAALAAKPSRRVVLEQVLGFYAFDDDTAQRLRSLLEGAVEAAGPYGDHASFGDPAFMGAYARNLLDRRNYVAVEGGYAYRSPPAEAEHRMRLDERRLPQERSAALDAKIGLATHDASLGSPEIAREAAAAFAGTFPDSKDGDGFDPRTQLWVSAMMLIARHGDEALLHAQEEWLRKAIAWILEKKADRPTGSGTLLAYNHPAVAVHALIHLWLRRGRKHDRDSLIASAIRGDRSAAMAFAAASKIVNDKDSRMLKAAIRVGFGACRWRRRSRGDEAASEAYVQNKATADARAVIAETTWLDGGVEPSWPVLPSEQPVLRRPLRIPLAQVPDADALDEQPVQKTTETEYADSQGLALWLSVITRLAPVPPPWGGEIVANYAAWSAKANGLGFPAEAELDRPLSEWNGEFCILLAASLLDADGDEFGRLMPLIEELPDQSFGDYVEDLIRAVDVRYFYNPRQSPERPSEVRRRLVRRTTALTRWQQTARSGDLSIDNDTGGLVAGLLMNAHSPFGITQTYLDSAIFDRIDPLLETLVPLIEGGPTPFVALCTMNTLSVTPRARHLRYFLSALEAWLERLPSDTAMWIELGIGRKAIDWLEKVAVEDPSLLQRLHPCRGRIDSIVGRLVSFGISEAHEFEKRVEPE